MKSFALAIFLFILFSYQDSQAYDDGFEQKSGLQGPILGGAGMFPSMGMMGGAAAGSDFSTQYGQHQPIRPIGVETQTAFIGANAACPFKTQSDGSTQQLIQQVRTTISNLAQECGDKIGPAITDVQTRLNAIEQMANANSQNRQVTDIGQMQVTCSNFQQVLKSEFQIVSKYANESTTLAMNPRYSVCAPPDFKSSNLKIEDCLRQTYMSDFSKISSSCRSSGSIQQTEQINKTLQSLTNQMIDLMNQAPQCKSKEKGMALAMKAGVQALNTVSIFSSGLGLPGLGLSLAGKLLDTIVGNFESTDSNQKFLAILANEDKYEDTACLWHSLQNKMLRCGEEDSSISEKSCESTQSIPLSSQQLTSLKDLRKVISQAKQAQDDEQTDRSIQQLKALLAKPVDLSDTASSTPKTVKELLLDIKNTLSTSSTKADLKSSAAIQELLSSVDSLDALSINKNISPEDKLKQIDTIYGKIQGALNGVPTMGPWGIPAMNVVGNATTTPGIFHPKESSSSKGPLDFDQALQSYIHKKFPEQAAAIQFEIGTKSVAQFETLKNNLPDPNYARLMMATNIMAKRFQLQSDERLDELNARYEESLKNPNNKLATLSHADLLIKTCALNAGLFYANQVDSISTQDSLGKLNAEATQNYKKICQKFMCSNGTGIPKITLNQSGDKENWLKFKTYQCSNIDRYPAFSKDILRNIKDKGTPCP